MDAVPVWIVVIALGCIGALAAILWKGSDRRHDRADAKIVDHESRITRAETKIEEVEKKAEKFGKARHDIMDEVTHALASWYTELVKLIKGGK